MNKASDSFTVGPHQKSTVNVPKTFLLSWLPLAALIAAMLLFVYYTQTKSARIITERTEANEVSTLKEVIAADLHSVVSDLMILADYHGLKRLLDGNPSYMSLLTDDYLTFSLRKGLYDQIRYLYETGKEVVRVNYNKGNHFVVPAEQLQNKGKRYYFNDAFVLEKGQVFVSPLDLNIERGAIEQPLKPMIRVGTPVFDSAGNKRGIVLINYLGDKLIRDVLKAYQGAGAQNLIANAMKFHKPNEPPTVTISSRLMDTPDIAPVSNNMGGSAEIVVQDNGIGFQQRYAERIFGTFQRLHGRRAFEGTGIGLSVCRKIVERHEGAIKAEGKPDEGARFIITLPLKQRKEAVDAAA